ncbi:hypothetical protein [Brevundimonas sp.]|uniref:hypothetical protein n=1 Tax=Brevundimonas sp. TaxID=1871086 RepID=UPI002ED9F3CF
MRSQLHMPHLWPRRHAAPGAAEHHHHQPDSQRFWRVERAFDYLVVAGIVILGAVMVYGLATASGDASWF